MSKKFNKDYQRSHLLPSEAIHNPSWEETSLISWMCLFICIHYSTNGIPHLIVLVKLLAFFLSPFNHQLGNTCAISKHLSRIHLTIFYLKPNMVSLWGQRRYTYAIFNRHSSLLWKLKVCQCFLFHWNPSKWLWMYVASEKRISSSQKCFNTLRLFKTTTRHEVIH